MNTPQSGEITVYSKSVVPERNAYIVASILLGVILAKYEKIGNEKNVVERVLKTTSQKNMKTTSDIPISRFHLFAKIKLKNFPVE